MTKTCRRTGNCPYSLAPEGPRVPLLELVDRYGVPTMAQGRGAPLELRRLHRRVHLDAPPCPDEPREARYDRPRAPRLPVRANLASQPNRCGMLRAHRVHRYLSSLPAPSHHARSRRWRWCMAPACSFEVT